MSNRTPNLSAGMFSDMVPVTPNDSTDNMAAAGDYCIGFYVTIGGTVSLINVNGVTRSITVADGSYHPFVGIKRIRATGTTATGISALIS